MEQQQQQQQQQSRAQVEVRGFAGFLATILLFTMYLGWAYIPDETLKAIGISYFPAKRWAIAIPFFFALTFFVSPLLYCGVNLATTEPLSSPLLITDFEEEEEKQNYELHCRVSKARGVPPIYDIPLAKVNARMFRKK